jgi:Nidogen-like
MANQPVFNSRTGLLANSPAQEATMTRKVVMLLVLTLAAVFTMTGLAQAANVVPGFNANNLPANDDGSTGLVPIGFSANFFGTTFTDLYVNNNGNVTFNTTLSTYTPFGLTTDIGTSIIAAFFADVDTRAGNIVTYGQGIYGGRAAFGVNWIDVGYYAYHIDKLNTFQLILVDRSDVAPGDFDIIFNYDKIQWETGDASGGSGGLGGSSAHVGYSNGTGINGTNLELAGSGVNGAFLDGGPDALISNSRWGGVPGHYIFQVRNGLPPVTHHDISPVYLYLILD